MVKHTDIISPLDFEFLKRITDSFYNCHLQQDLLSCAVAEGWRAGRMSTPTMRYWTILCSEELRPFFLRRDTSVGDYMLDMGEQTREAEGGGLWNRALSRFNEPEVFKSVVFT
uniref:Uncharacterized protein n=1 Tax=Corethron hystrix TaxID=216773 RepID=A0A7S1B816_9STRA